MKQSSPLSARHFNQFIVRNAFLLFLLLNTANVFAQNWGFEATPVASPPSNWTIVTGTWTVNTNATYVRSGTQSMKIVDPATTGTTIGTTTAFNTTTAPGYIITMGWGKSNTASNALFYTGYRTGTTNTFNPTTTTTGQAANINNSTWSRVISVSTSSTIAAGNYGIPIRAFRSAATAGTEVYLDDFISYGSTSNVPDISAPLAASGVTIAGNLISWTNGTDLGAPASGIGGVVIIRANTAFLTPPSLNDQAMYNAVNGAAGLSSFSDGSNTWTVVASINNSSTTSFTDASAGGGPYTYVVYMRDLAYNYSSGSAGSAASPCTDPPTAGSSQASAGAVCSGAILNLSLTGNSAGLGQTYQWQSSSTIGGTYTNIGSVQSSPALSINPTTALYYRCEVVCSGGTPAYSTPVQVTINPGFSGTYTINSALPTGGSNFQTFTDAVAAMGGCGINGPVVFNVDPASGPYNEQITLSSSIGSNAVNTVTFNGNGRTIQFSSTNTNARHVIKLDGADYITFNELNINASGGTYGWGIHFINGADFNAVNLCTITASITDNTSGNHQPIVMSNSSTAVTTVGNNGSNNTFQDNTFIGGYYAITLCGTAAGSENSGNLIANNIMRDFYSYGVYMTYQKNSTVSGCDLSRPNRTASTTTAGVFMTTGAFGNLVENNRIHNYFDAMTTSTSTMYGVYEASSGTLAEPTRVINNVIYNINSNGSIYGIYNTGAAYENIYHNTISLDYAAATAGLAYGIYQTGAATNINVRNNIVTIARGGTGAKVGLYYNTPTSGITSNNNAVFLNSAGSGTQNYGSSGTAGSATLALWQTANGGLYDANSVEANPFYTSAVTGDFTPTSVVTNNIGFNVGVGFDINGNPRSGTPDPGAYEYSLAGLDASISWVSPTSPTTPGLKTITVNVTNNLTTNVSSLVLSYTDGGTPVTQTFSGLSLLPSTSQTFSFSVQYNMIGNTALYAYINSVNGILDNVQVNDTTNVQNLCVSMSGAYTLNAGAPASATNFQSFASLAATLSCGGVTGPVTVDVVAGSGPYSEQASFGAISGTSFTNTVTINGNGNTLTFPSGTEYHTLRLNGADYMTWNNLNIATTGTATGFAMNVMNASDFNNFNNCTFSVPLSASATATSCVAFSGSASTINTAGNNGNNNTFTGCTMSGGYYCISVYGLSTGNIVGNTFVNCTIKEYYVYGLYNVYGGTTIVRDCIFERPTRASVSTGYGVYLSTNSAGCLIERNRVRNMFGGAITSTSTCYALGCVVAATSGNENKFINNLVSDINSSGTIYGLYFSGGSYVQAYHNTISLDQTAATGTTTTYGIYSTGTAGVDVKNNIVSVRRGGTGTKYCAYYSAISGVSSNNNNYYLNSSTGTNYIAYDGVTSFATLAAYQTANPTKDPQSVSINPSFNNPGTQNYQPTEATLNDLGANLGVAVDITGAPRGATPDMGAYEFSVAAIDAGVLSLTAPGAGGCYSSAENIIATIKNFGSNTIDFAVNPLTVTCDVTGAVSTTLSFTPSGTLAPGATMSVTLTPALNMSFNGTYNFNIYTTMTGDGNPGNDALNPAESRIVGPVGGTIAASVASICVSGNATFTLSGNYGGSVQWKESTVSATGPWTNVGTGTSTYTPAASITQTTYYVVEVSCNGNTSQSNVFTMVVNDPQLLGTTPGSRCGIGTVTLGASVNPGNSARWYANASGGTALATGNSFVTPTISATTTYYVAANAGGGTTQISSNGVPTVTTSTQNGGLQFTLFQDVVLNSIQVYSTAAGTATVTLENSANVVLFVSPAIPIVASNLSTPQTLPLGWSIPAGVGYHIKVANTGNALGYATGAFPAPMGNGVGTITSGWLSASTSTLNYFVYNMNTTTGCEGSRVPVVATVTAPPAITASAVDPILCPGNSTSISVSSPNDPNYTYDWTSSPGTFTATGAGPHTISPTTTTIYTVTATDNTSGPNAGCVNVATVTVVTAPSVVAGTISTPINSYCASGTPVLSLTGSAGGAIQWQSSSVSATGPWTNVGTGTASYTPASALNQTTYFQAMVSCGATTVYSNVMTITVNNPQVLTTTPASRCGIGSVTLGATSDPGNTIKWYSTPTGGVSLATGNSFATPTIASTTTYYASASAGLGSMNVGKVSLSPGSTQNTGTAAYIIFDAISGFTLNTVDIYPYGTTNAVAGTMTISLDNSSGVSLQTTTVSVIAYTAANPTMQTVPVNFNITPGTGYRLRFSAYTGGVTGALRDLTTATPPAVFPYTIPGVVSITNSSAAGYYYYFYNWSVSSGCEGTRTPVTATITAPPAMTVSAADPTLCPGGTTSVSVSSPNDPNYTYTWSSIPGGFTATGNGPHTVSPTTTTKYYVSAIDNSAGSFAGCANLDSVTVITAATLSAGTVSASQTQYCVTGTPTLMVTGSSGGAIQWQTSTVSATGPWTNVGTGATTYTPTLSQTTYIRVDVSCQSTSVQSNVVTVNVTTPSILSTTPGVVCGTSGSATLMATSTAGSVPQWYTTPTGGTAVGTGNSYTTPVISSSTNYYASALEGSGGIGTATMPAQSTTFSGNVRGYWFTAPAAFTITSVHVPMTGTSQSIAIVKFNGSVPPPTYSTTTNAFTTLFLTQNNSNTGAITCNVAVAAGDVIGMLGQMGNVTSYGPATNPTSITIAGSPVSLTRMGMQFPLGTTAPQDLWQEVTATSNIGRVEFTYTQGCEGLRTAVPVTVGPCNSTLNLTCLIQGYWDGTSMLPVLANQFEPTTPTACDSIDVELRDGTTYALAQSVRTVLQQNGTATCIFPPVSGSYYIVIKHRNAIQTWSANPVVFGATPVTYDFTTTANKAYGDNQKEVSPGVFALYSGDVVVDENMDLLDINAVEADITAFGSGYLPTDINGDGNVDLLDSPPAEDNISSFIFSNHP